MTRIARIIICVNLLDPCSFFIPLVFGILYLRDVIYRRQVISCLGGRDDGMAQLRLQLLASGLGHTATFLGHLGALGKTLRVKLRFSSSSLSIARTSSALHSLDRRFRWRSAWRQVRKYLIPHWVVSWVIYFILTRPAQVVCRARTS